MVDRCSRAPIPAEGDDRRDFVFHCASYAVGARFPTTHHLSGGQKSLGFLPRRWKKVDEVAFWDEGNPGRVLANVCGRLEMNKFHPCIIFFNGPHCARPEQIYF
jgi:hypothetical protein